MNLISIITRGSMVASLIVLMAIGPAQMLAAPLPPTVQAEVIVYGGTPGGIMAAVAAARRGHSVALVDINNHVGGMISGGLVNTDIGDRKTVGGLAREFLERAVKHYSDTYGPESPQFQACKNWRKYETHIAELVFEQMLKEQPRITALIVDDLAGKTTRTFTGDVFIEPRFRSWGSG